MPLTAFFCYFSGLFPKIPKIQKKKEGLKMNYRKTFSRITLIAWSTIAVILVMWSIVLHPAEADSLFYPAGNYDTGDEPYSVAIGDLNGDGDPDKSLLLNLQNTCDIHLISVKLPKLRYSQRLSKNHKSVNLMFVSH
jgi:hypothetical protein